MMIAVRKAEERGHFDHGWLNTYHTFSFADYYDPQHMGFRTLRVINEDRVQPGRGFATHAHQDMEIMTYVLEGALAHKDSMGTGSIIRPDDVQRMSAGTGVTHSEYNDSKSEPVYLLQIWILPERRGLTPEYEQKHFPESEKRDVLRLIASRSGRDGSVTIHQDVDVHATILGPGKSVRHALRPGRSAWVQVVRGASQLNGHRLNAGDGAAISDEAAIEMAAEAGAEVLLFDLA
jgi:redox-sensitive bicupin YhaK (pirin superfamily)